MKSTTQHWLFQRQYDIDTLPFLLKSKRWLYVGFLCHQSTEKTLKAYWSEVLEETPLKIHTLNRLAEKSGIKACMSEEQVALLGELEPLNIRCRYPETKNEILQRLTPSYCKSLVKRTKELQTWILNKLSRLPDNTNQQC